MKTNQSLIILIILVFSVISCKNKKSEATLNSGMMAHHKDETTKHWSYQGESSPEHWAEIEKQSDCAGINQSPINIIEVDSWYAPKDSLNLKIDYNSQTLIHDVINNGHTVQFDFELGDMIRYKNEVYDLKQIHFHESSEHTIDGIRFPIEIHLVHVNTTGVYTVLSILGKEGKEHIPFEFLEFFLPIKNGATKTIGKPFDLNSIFPENTEEYYSYDGSFTTPPCSETVNWIVFKQPIILSLNQVLKLKDNMPLNNYRNEQPLNNRKVIKTFE